MNNEMSAFAKTIMEQKYAHTKESGDKESWEDIAKRVAKSVMSVVPVEENFVSEIEKIIADRKFIPGGRYLFASGNEYHQVQNCLLFKAEDSREGWSDLLYKISMALMSGAGIGVVYNDIRAEGKIIKKTGGTATGPLALMQMINECGRGIMNGGNRRAAIWAGLSWQHPDIHKFIVMKNWSKEIRDLKEKDFNFPAPMDMTNISVLLDDDFFLAFYDETNEQHSLAQSVYWATVKQMMKTSEPGFSIDTGKNKGETARNACCPSYTQILTRDGIKQLGEVNVGDYIWSGKDWTKIIKKWSTGIKPVYKYTTTIGQFIGTDNHNVYSHGEKIEVKDAQSIDLSLGPETDITIDQLNPCDIMDGLLIGDGSVHKASNNLVYLNIGENDQDYFNSEIFNLLTRPRPGLSKYAHEVFTTLDPQELPKTFDREVPNRFLYGSAKKKLGFLRGLFSANGSVNGDRICLKQASKKLIEQVQIMLSSLGVHSYITTNKSKTIKFSNGEYDCKKSYDLNITNGRTIFANSIGFLQKYKNEKVIPGGQLRQMTSEIKSVEYIEDTEVFEITVDCKEHTFWTAGQLVSNCCEVSSYDDSDICNLGSINLARIESIEDMKKTVELATAFLLAGSIYSDVPTEKSKAVRDKNRRLGLGLMGVHEWLISRGKKYDIDTDLEEYLKEYAKSTEISHKYAEKWNCSKPIKTRAIAPTGTIGIVGETTTGIEPIFCVSYKRRYLKHKSWNYQYVIDPTAKKLIDQGINPEHIEDAYSLADNVERRVAFQAWVQQYVDHCISSTVNFPPWGSEINNESKVVEFGNMLLKYLPKLRGLTLYADGSRGGQPLTPVKYHTASKHIGEVFIEGEKVVYETADVCDISKGGSCGA